MAARFTTFLLSNTAQNSAAFRPLMPLVTAILGKSRNILVGEQKRGEPELEATPGIEPGCTDLQSAASPLRHVAYLVGAKARDIAKLIAWHNR